MKTDKTEQKAESTAVAGAAATEPADLQGLTDAVMQGLGYTDGKSQESTAKPKTDKQDESETPPTSTSSSSSSAAPATQERKEGEDEVKVKPKKGTLRTNEEETQRVAELAAEKAAKKVRDMQPAPPVKADAETKAPAVKDEEAEEDAQTRAVFQVMAENPKFAGLPERFDKFLKEESAYKVEWLKANPGKTFDPEAEVHATFYDAHEPEFDDTAFHRAEAKLEVRQEIESKLKREEDQKRATTVKQEAQKRSTDRQNAAVQDVVNRVVPADLAKKHGLNLDALEEENPAVGLVVRTQVERMAPLLAEVSQVLDPTIGAPINVENPIHQDMLKRVAEIEETLKSKPDAETQHRGRSFADLETYNAMPPAQRARYWTIWQEPDMVSAVISSGFAKVATAKLAKMGISGKAAAAPAASQKTTDEGAGSEAAASAKPNPPNTATRSDTATAGGASGGVDPGLSESITQALFS